MKSTIAIRPEINMTPLIDVLLVMLVIFMAAVTLTQQAIESQIPQAARQLANARPDQIVVELSADRTLAVNKQAVTSDQRGSFLRTVYKTRSDKTIYVAAAGTLPYGAIIDVMDAAKGAGVDRVGVITDGMRRNAAR
jgi:biopolymer transport protein ExbD